MIRKALKSDIEKVAQIYDHIHDRTDNAAGKTGWIKGIYPTIDTAKNAFSADELYIMEDENGKVVAAARINQKQEESYKKAEWLYKAEPQEVLVLHTLVVDPMESGKGYGRKFVAFYEDLAKKRGIKVLRMDTNEKNTPARTLYGKLGFHEAGIVPCDFNGLPDIMLVCLEKKL